MRANHSLLLTTAVILATNAAAASDLHFEELPYSDAKVAAGWADFRSYEQDAPPERMGGGPAVAVTAEVLSGGHTWTIMQLHDRGWCGMNTCITRVFRDGEVWLSADLCSPGIDYLRSWSIEADGKKLSACGERYDLARQDVRPETTPSGHHVPAPGWSERIEALNRAGSLGSPSETVSARTGKVLGEPFDHNGSLMTIAHDDGLIIYAEPKRSIAGTVKPGTVLFRGDLTNPNRVNGIAYTFKKGCNPAPYPVSGRFTEGQLSGTLTLTGKAPVRAKNGCEVTGYSAKGGNARLVFEYVAPPEL